MDVSYLLTLLCSRVCSSTYKNNIYYKAVGCVMQTPASDVLPIPPSLWIVCEGID